MGFVGILSAAVSLIPFKKIGKGLKKAISGGGDGDDNNQNDKNYSSSGGTNSTNNYNTMNKTMIVNNYGYNYGPNSQQNKYNQVQVYQNQQYQNQQYQNQQYQNQQYQNQQQNFRNQQFQNQQFQNQQQFYNQQYQNQQLQNQMLQNHQNQLQQQQLFQQQMQYSQQQQFQKQLKSQQQQFEKSMKQQQQKHKQIEYHKKNNKNPSFPNYILKRPDGLEIHYYRSNRQYNPSCYKTKKKVITMRKDGRFTLCKLVDFGYYLVFAVHLEFVIAFPYYENEGADGVDGFYSFMGCINPSDLRLNLMHDYFAASVFQKRGAAKTIYKDIIQQKRYKNSRYVLQSITSIKDVDQVLAMVDKSHLKELKNISLKQTEILLNDHYYIALAYESNIQYEKF